MAEKGTLIIDQAGGKSIAVRDAFEQDDQANARVIQRLDLSQGRFASPIGVATRITTTPDAPAVVNFPAELTDNLIDCGDKKTLIITAEIAGFSGGWVDITPIAYDGEATPGVIGVLEKQRLRTTDNHLDRNTGNNDQLMLHKTWELNGASKIGIHITDDEGFSTSIQTWGWVI